MELSGPAVLDQSSAHVEGEHVQLLTAGILLRAALCSVALHVVAPLVFGLPSGVLSVSFLTFALSDTLLVAIALVPVIGVWRGALAWHDPFAYLGFLSLLSTCTFYAAYLFYPEYLPVYASFLGENFSGLTDAALQAVFARAALVQAVFLMTVVYLNRRRIQPTFVRVGRTHEAYAATLSGALLMTLGVLAFVKLRSTPYFAQVIENLGGILATPPPGMARYVVLAGVGAAAVPLALIGWLNVVAPQARRLSWAQSAIPAGLIALSVVPSALVGSRIGVVFAAFVALAMLKHFGFTLSGRVVAAIVLVALVGGLAVSVLRANPGPESLGQRLTDSGSIAQIYGTKGRLATLALNMDRTANTALVVRQIDSTGRYLNGASLLAGWDSLGHDLGQRLGLEGGAWEPLLTPQQYMEVWRFGQVRETSPVPPGLAGQFYMDAGYVGVLLLSCAFGFLFAYFRRWMWMTSSLGGRWLLAICLFTVANALLSQTSVLAAQLGLTVAAMAVAFLVMRAVVRISVSRES